MNVFVVDIFDLKRVNNEICSDVSGPPNISDINYGTNVSNNCMLLTTLDAMAQRFKVETA